MKKISAYILSILGLFIFSIQKAAAVCPVCTIAVGAGVGLSRWLGIDDTITGLWIGGLVVCLISWTETWLDRKNLRFKGRVLADILIYYLAVIVPLYYAGLIGGGAANAVWGIDKLLFGIVAGSAAFWLSVRAHYYLKKKNNGRVYFPLQKVAMPVGFLILASAVLYFLTK